MTWTTEQIRRLSAYVDRPWPAGCWDWVRFVRHEFYGLDTPFVPYNPADVLPNARLIAQFESDLNFCGEVKTPDDGDIVSMGHGQYGMHVGVFAKIDRGVVLHTERGHEVLATPISRLAWSRVKFFHLKDAA